MVSHSECAEAAAYSKGRSPSNAHQAPCSGAARVPPPEKEKKKKDIEREPEWEGGYMQCQNLCFSF